MPTPTQLKDFRVRAGGAAICEFIAEIPAEEIILELYLPIKDTETQQLANFFEKQLVLAKVNKKRFLDDRPRQVREIVNWIKSGKRYRLFAAFSMYIARNLDKRPRPILFAFQSGMMDVWANLAPFGKLWYGMDGDQPMFIPELYGSYDTETYNLFIQIQQADKRRDHREIAKLFKRYQEVDQETLHTRINERNIANVIYDMIGLITPENESFIFPDAWSEHYLISLEFPDEANPTDFYLEKLNTRSHLLDSEGVAVQCFNAGQFKEIRFKEQFMTDGMVILYRATLFDGKHTMGFIDLRDGYVETAWRGAQDPMNFNAHFTNFILEVYCSLTCDFESRVKVLAIPERVDKLSAGQIGLCYPDGTHKSRHKVHPFIRKGTPSEMAIANARLYGLVLPQGYTFVREHWRGRSPNHAV